MSKHVLLIKLTSMGDLIHTLPALTDAAEALPGITFDWVVDEAFADVPSWHPNVNRIIKSAHRRWKKKPTLYLFNGELRHFYNELNNTNYDIILDAQSNIKSAITTRLKRGQRHGMDKFSVREKPAHWAYQHQHRIEKYQHSIARLRLLFAKALGYEKPNTPANHGIDHSKLLMPQLNLPENYLVFVHNASWTTKLWPTQHWRHLIEKAQGEGYSILLPCGNEQEHSRALHLSQGLSQVIALPKLSLSHIAGIINQAKGAVCCDTGLAHIASMLDIPSVSFYGPTDHILIGATGLKQYHCTSNPSQFSCAPCYEKQCHYRAVKSEIAACMEAFTPSDVWDQLKKLMLI